MKGLSKFAAVAILGALSATSWGVTAKVCLDPGHGGSDPGGVGSGQQEKYNVLNTCFKFRDWLNADSSDGAGGGSWTVIMTRTSDVYVGLSTRAAYANNNGANRFTSMHNNACCGASGTETFSYTSASSTSNDLRNKTQQRSVEAWGLSNRGNKTANFAVLRETNMPAILPELGFIDHPYDSQFVGNSTQQDKMMKYHMFALQNHYGISTYTPGTGAATVYDHTPDVSANWTEGSAAADKYGSVYYYRTTAPVSDQAQFLCDTTGTGLYDIYAWWPANTNRSPTPPFILPDGSTVSVNQQINGGQWNLLGTIQFNVNGVHYCNVSCWTTSGAYVLADALKMVGPK